MQKQQNFIKLIKDNEGIIYKITLVYAFNEEDQKDLYQEIVYQLWKSFDSFRGGSKISTWMYRIAINTAKNHIVAARRRPLEYASDISEPEEFDWHPSLQNPDSPERQAMGDDLRKAVETTIASLPEELRAAITLRELDGLSYEEISQVMECPVGTVRSRIFRAREALDKSIRLMIDETGDSGRVGN